MLYADIAIFAMNENRKVTSALQVAGQGSVQLSSLVLSQLLQGVSQSDSPTLEQVAVETFVASIDLRAYDRAAAFAYGRIISAIGFSRRDAVDRMIAAHAISLGATLVTNNLKDFTDIPGLELVNWAQP